MALFFDIDAFLANLPHPCRVLGLDLGTKTIGVAVSDPALLIAMPVLTIQRKTLRDDLIALRAVVNERPTIAGIVLGWPLHINGEQGRRCQATRAFAQSVHADCSLPIGLYDERLSTQAAERALLDADLSRRNRRYAINHVAASYILQGVLDRWHTTRQTKQGY